MQKVNRQNRISFGSGKDSGFMPLSGLNEVILSKPAPLYVSYDGGAGILIDYGTHIKFTLEDLNDAIVWSSTDGVYLDRSKTSVEPSGEVFTNFDKRPGKSLLEQSVALALRKMQLQAKADRAERARMDREMIAAKKLEAKNPPEPEPVEADESQTVPPDDEKDKAGA